MRVLVPEMKAKDLIESKADVSSPKLESGPAHGTEKQDSATRKSKKSKTIEKNRKKIEQSKKIQKIKMSINKLTFLCNCEPRSDRNVRRAAPKTNTSSRCVATEL